jgi:hypothetical protein
MKPEGPPFYGLICECGMGATYAFAVREGFVDEIRPGDRARAIEAYKERMAVTKVLKEARKAAKIPGPPKRYRHVKFLKDDYQKIENAKATFVEIYGVEGELSEGIFLMCLVDAFTAGQEKT